MSRRLGARFVPATPAAEAPSAAAAGSRHGAGRPASLRRRLASRRVGVVLLASVIGSVGLASCAAGNDAVTNLARTTTNSVAGAVGSITLRNVYLAGPVSKGDSAQVVSAIFNAGTEPDSIVGISSPLAASGQVPAQATLSPGAGQIYIVNGSAPTLVGIKQDLLVGSQLPITFTFAKAGSVTLTVPVEEPAPGASAAPSVTPTESTAPITPAGATPSEATPSEATSPGVGANPAGTQTPASLEATPTAATS